VLQAGRPGLHQVFGVPGRLAHAQAAHVGQKAAEAWVRVGLVRAQEDFLGLGCLEHPGQALIDEALYFLLVKLQAGGFF